jgi:hypothetical protein
MKATIDLEWRWLEEPEHHLESVLTHALKKAGYDVGRIFIQGHHLEDKPEIKFSDGDRLPHEEVAYQDSHIYAKI